MPSPPEGRRGIVTSIQATMNPTVLAARRANAEAPRRGVAPPYRIKERLWVRRGLAHAGSARVFRVRACY